jgi:hypothetical protein
MAGAKPEYMPALLATVQAADLVQTRSQIGGRFPTVAVSTNGFGFMQVINGAYAKEIGMNSGRGALGPGYRPNATTVDSGTSSSPTTPEMRPSPTTPSCRSIRASTFA